LLLSVNPGLTPDQVKAYLTATATPAPGKNPGEFDPKYGYGTLNVFAALRAAATNQFPALPAGIRE
jgi:subtilisin family serine protease